MKETHSLVPIRSGRGFRVVSPPRFALVTKKLAIEAERILEHFALDSGFNDQCPVTVEFRPGIFGHHRFGRAADIYAVGGIGIDEWQSRWRSAGGLRLAERMRNLGWRLYKALQHYGRWVQPYGFPIQLFGPWTREAGPWKFISQRMLKAHRDHIHFAL